VPTDLIDHDMARQLQELVARIEIDRSVDGAAGRMGIYLCPLFDPTQLPPPCGPT
jgi:hypothetical protein